MRVRFDHFFHYWCRCHLYWLLSKSLNDSIGPFRNLFLCCFVRSQQRQVGQHEEPPLLWRGRCWHWVISDIPANVKRKVDLQSERKGCWFLIRVVLPSVARFWLSTFFSDSIDGQVSLAVGALGWLTPLGQPYSWSMDISLRSHILEIFPQDRSYLDIQRFVNYCHRLFLIFFRQKKNDTKGS